MVYTAAVIGVGRIGMAYDASHASAYTAIDDIEIDCIADVDPDVLQKYGNQWDIPSSNRYTDHVEMLDQHDVDVVSVATPAAFHRTHVIDAVDSPANPDVVWCEKPISTNVAAAEEMVERCEDQDVELVINHQLRFASPFQALREYIHDDDILGEITSIAGQISEGEGLLRNITHQLDLLFYVAGERLGGDPTTVSCFGTAARTSNNSSREMEFNGDMGGRAMILMDNGKTIMIDHCAGYNIDGGSGIDTIHMVGTEGRLSVGTWRFPNDGYNYLQRQGEGHFCDYATEPLPAVDSSTPAVDALNLSDVKLGSIDDARISPELTAFLQDAMENVVKHIRSLLDGEENTQRTAEDAVLILELIIAFFVSHYTGSHITLPLDPPMKDIGAQNLSG